MSMSDEQLRLLQRQHGPSLLAYFLRRAQPPEDAAALLNDLLVVVWRKASEVPPDPEQARMWMFGIARKLVSTHHRAAHRRRALAERLRDAVAASTPDSRDDVVERVRAAVENLPEAQRELVRLIHWDGFSLAEAATITGVTPSTARSRYLLARRRLATALEATAEDPFPILETSR
jgi:RNA polymerase sigma-70 factor, ECF subfamily